MKITRLTAFVRGASGQFADSDTVTVTVDEEKGIARIDAQTFRQVFVGLLVEIVSDVTQVAEGFSV